jgi:hypothetical protein
MEAYVASHQSAMRQLASSRQSLIGAELRLLPQATLASRKSLPPSCSAAAFGSQETSRRGDTSSSSLSFDRRAFVSFDCQPRLSAVTNEELWGHVTGPEADVTVGNRSADASSLSAQLQQKQHIKSDAALSISAIGLLPLSIRGLTHTKKLSAVSSSKETARSRPVLSLPYHSPFFARRCHPSTPKPTAVQAETPATSLWLVASLGLLLLSAGLRGSLTLLLPRVLSRSLLACAAAAAMLFLLKGGAGSEEGIAGGQERSRVAHF